MLTLQLSQADIATLNYDRFHHPCPMIQKRLHAVYYKATQGFTNQAVGWLCDMHRHSVSTYVNLCKSEGITALYHHQYKGHPSALIQHQASLQSILSLQPVHTLSEAKTVIESLTGITRSLTSIRTFMIKSGFSYQKIGHIPAKADSQKQQDYIQQILQPAIEKAQNGQIHLLFVDAAHFVMGAFLSCVWSLTRLFIKSPSGRQRLNVIGALDAISNQVLFQFNTSYVDALVLCQFLEFLKKQMPDKPIHLVLDNARYQHCQLVKNLALDLGITLLFLPAYSPNLNLIERLWKFVKKEVLYAKFYENFQDFQQSIVDCLNNTNTQFKPQIQRLMTLKFQSFDFVHIYPV